MPPLEAMQLGCPVIVSDNSALPEVVGSAGIQVEAEDVQQVIQAILKMQEPKARASFIEKGKRQSQKFSWEKSAQKYLETNRLSSGLQNLLKALHHFAKFVVRFNIGTSSLGEFFSSAFILHYFLHRFV